MAHAKALFFIKNEQGQIGQLYVAGKHAVRADENIHLARCRSLEHFLLPWARHKTAEQAHVDGKTRQTRTKGLVVLLGQHGCGAEQNHLPPL